MQMETQTDMSGSVVQTMHKALQDCLDAQQVRKPRKLRKLRKKEKLEERKKETYNETKKGVARKTDVNKEFLMIVVLLGTML